MKRSEVEEGWGYPRGREHSDGPSRAGGGAPPTYAWKAIQDVAGESVTLAYVDQGYTGETPETAAPQQGIEVGVVKLSETKRGFVLLPRRWVVEMSLAWATRCQRLIKDYERCASTLAGVHVVDFACFMLKLATILTASS